MDNPLQGALQKMGSNFLVAAFVPAMAFIIFSALIFFPVLPDSMVNYLGWSVTKPEQITIATALLFTMILGFTLFTLSTYIYKSFEGYTFIFHPNTFLGKALLQRQKRRAHRLEIAVGKLQKEKQKIECAQVKIKEQNDLKKSPLLERRLRRYEKRISDLRDQLHSLIAFNDANFPASRKLILPTRFGNILRAAETYPGIRYAIDAVPLWGRMSHVIPLDAMEKIDQANNQCLFLLNSALLAGVFSVMSVFASVYLAYIIVWAPQYHFYLLTFMKTTLTVEHLAIYIVLAFFSAMIAYFFYQASLLNVSQYGSMIRTAYDLYRFNLIEKLHLDFPKSLKDERILWQKISQFFVIGEAFGEIDFKYHFNDKEIQQNSSQVLVEENVPVPDELFNNS